MLVGPFHITSADIRALNDEQLRNVLRLFLEAEAVRQGIPLSAIRMGGDQNASDGGVDARVEWGGKLDRTDWLPRQFVIFQCKAEPMPRSKLKDELAPSGVPRRFFVNLASRDGAYIVFSSDDCTEPMYQERLSAMRDAAAVVPGATQIAFDFYDASRIARWVSCHPGVASEVRTLAGRPMAGWRPFENWSAPSLPISADYLLDEKPKATFINNAKEPAPVVEAIDEVRKQLRAGGLAVRLIGVSGVGKTRFAQALFDERIGRSALGPGAAVYGDLAQSPGVIASQVAEQLVHAQQRAVLIVDNCPGDTHRALVAIIQRSTSQVGLLTIDFDVGSDQPESTHVVQLHRNSDSLVEALLVARAPTLSPLDRRRVVEFADGNARVALTIAANEVGSGSLANLSDRQLIDRLFLDGRRPTDDTLRRCAEVSSLVYAFHVDRENDQEPEHPALAELAEVSSLQMYRAIAEFVERGTAQKRGTQRAILPHALAIRLATQALERLPSDTVLACFYQQRRERLFRSFTRRLGQLHQSEPACKIAERLLGENGDLCDPTTLSPYGIALFENLAPAAPKAALDALERAIDGPRGQEFASLDNSSRWRFAGLARSLAYDATQFERAARVLLAFAKAEPEGHNQNAVQPHFLELFWLHLSWTQAPPEQRYRFIDRLLAQGDDIEKQIAIRALDHALTTGPWSSSYDGRFGARAMGQEWRPKTYAEQEEWFRQALTRLATVVCQDGELGNRARTAISHEIRGLIRVGLVDDLGAAVDSIRAKSFWPDGWKLLCEALHFDQKGWSTEVRTKVGQLEQRLRPVSIGDRFVAYVTNEPWGLYPVDPKAEDGEERDMFSAAHDVGEQAAKMPDLWPSLARRASAFRGSSNCNAFGRGLASGASNVGEMWRELVSIFKAQEPGTRNAAILGGFLQSAANVAPDDVQKWLDDAVVDESLGPHIVELSIHLPIDRRSMTRLTAAVQAGKAPIQTYGWLQAGRVTIPTPPDALAEFLQALLRFGGEGSIIAANILSMYLHGMGGDGTIDPAILNFGRAALQSSNLYQSISRNDGYRLGEIAKRCLTGAEHAKETHEIFTSLLTLARSNHSFLYKMDELIRMLGLLHPKIVLEVGLADDDVADLVGEHIFGHTDDEPGNRREAAINDNAPLVLEWVLEQPGARAVRVARFVRYFHEESGGVLSWTPIASALTNLPDIGLSVLDEFYSRFPVGSSYGPWSSRFVRRRHLLETLTSHADSSISSWAKGTLAKLDAHVANLIEDERVRDERFE